jgi:hypothetical protein
MELVGLKWEFEPATEPAARVLLTEHVDRAGEAPRWPMAAWREGISGGLPETAVAMALRLDNAKASPTATANCGLIIGRRASNKKAAPSGPTVRVHLTDQHRFRNAGSVVHRRMGSEVEPMKQVATMIRTHRRLDAMGPNQRPH